MQRRPECNQAAPCRAWYVTGFCAEKKYGTCRFFHHESERRYRPDTSLCKHAQSARGCRGGRCPFCDVIGGCEHFGQGFCYFRHVDAPPTVAPPPAAPPPVPDASSIEYLLATRVQEAEAAHKQAVARMQDYQRLQAALLAAKKQKEALDLKQQQRHDAVERLTSEIAAARQQQLHLEQQQRVAAQCLAQFATTPAPTVTTTKTTTTWSAPNPRVRGGPSLYDQPFAATPFIFRGPSLSMLSADLLMPFLRVPQLAAIVCHYLVIDTSVLRRELRYLRALHREQLQGVGNAPHEKGLHPGVKRLEHIMARAGILTDQHEAVEAYRRPNLALARLGVSVH